MGMFSRLTRLGGRDMAVDLGTASTLVYVQTGDRDADGGGSEARDRLGLAAAGRAADRAAVKETLDRTPPELVGDIMDRGITLAGGGALLQGLEQRLRDECQMPCQLAESPMTCVAVGSGISLEEVETIQRAGKNNGARPRRQLTAHAKPRT
jgi:actin-like ATPase involved in cell morphogenesis